MSYIRRPAFNNPVIAMIGPLVETFLAYEKELIVGRLNDLLKENKVMGGTQGAYFYEGMFYSLAARSSFKGIDVKPIVPALEKRAHTICEQTQGVEVMRQKLMQSFAVISRICKSKQDLRDALPDTLVADIPSLQNMERFRSEGEILSDRPAILQQYQRAVDIALQLKGKRLIYG
jgi:hypothetical protein